MIHSQCFLCLLSLFRYIKGTVKLGKSLKLRTNEFVYLTLPYLSNVIKPLCQSETGLRKC